MQTTQAKQVAKDRKNNLDFVQNTLVLKGMQSRAESWGLRNSKWDGGEWDEAYLHIHIREVSCEML